MGTSVISRGFKFVRLISDGNEIVIRPTNGQNTIAKADSVFKAGIDSDFLKYKSKIGDKPTKKMKVQVFEQTHDTKLPQIFGDFGQKMDQLCMTQDQIISFIENHDKWLSRNGWGTFFLFKIGAQHFVASVNRNTEGFYVYLFRLFNGGHTLLAKDEHRIVVPQL